MPVTFVEYSDFQCPFGRESSGTFKCLVEKYEGEEGESLGVTGTPSLFVNGRHAPNYWFDALESIIDHIVASGSP